MGKGGWPVRVTDATRLRDCEVERSRRAGEGGVVRVHRELRPADAALTKRAAGALLRERGGGLEMATSLDAVRLALMDRWRVDGRVVL